MVTSMTGFGRGKGELASFTVTVEIKTVNHRFLEFQMRTPRQLVKIEDRLKKKISEYINRGRVEVFIVIEGKGVMTQKVFVDWDLLDEYYHSIMQIKEKYQLEEKISLQQLLMRDEFISIDEEDSSNEELENLIIDTAARASQQLMQMRIKEGKALEKDVESHLLTFTKRVQHLKDHAPIVVQQYAERLKKRMEEFTSSAIDEARIINEVAIFADKADINEELTRLQSHIEQFQFTMKLDEPMGRKLDFFLQEMNREVNTIGSKANDSRIAREVVEMKSLLEKMKEQVQNIE